MGDHGIVSGYRAGVAGLTEPVLLSAPNDAAEAWGLRLYRSTLYAFCAAPGGDGSVPGDEVRPLVHQVMDAFWCHPNPAEALAWEPIPTTATRPGPRYVRWPGHSPRMAGLPAAIVHGSRDHSP